MKKEPFKIPPFQRPWQLNVRQTEQMDIGAMNGNLLIIKKILDKYQITFALIGGGLLGVIREGKFINYDHDIDIACFNNTGKKDHWKMRWVKNELINQGFHIVDNSRARCKSDFFTRNHERIDIFWFEKIDEEWIHSNELRYPAHFFDKLEAIHFLKTTFKVPQNPKEFLEYTYGKDWRTPKKGAHILDLNPKEVRKRLK